MNGEKVIAIAKKEIGVTEVPFNSNKTKYGKWFGLDGVMWCGIFVSWCYDKAGFPLGNIYWLFEGICALLLGHGVYSMIMNAKDKKIEPKNETDATQTV